MAIGKFDFFSNALRRMVTFRIILPNDIGGCVKKNSAHYKRPMKTVYLLHGYCGSSLDWLLHSAVVDLAAKYNLCVIMPSGENSFYLDAEATGHQYGTYVGDELVAYTRKTFGLSSQKEDTFIGGFSMGGFGALHTGLMYNHTFGKIFAFSSANIINEFANMEEGTGNNVANYAYYEQIFGDAKKVLSSTNNPEELIRRIQEKNDVMPEIYMACGTEDFLLEENRAFRAMLDEHKVEYTYKESAGGHDFRFWNEYLEPAIIWCVKP